MNDATEAAFAFVVAPHPPPRNDSNQPRMFMPSPTSYWLTTTRADNSSSADQLEDLQRVLGHGKLGRAAYIDFPQFKLAKQDPAVSAALAKTVDQIRSLTSADSQSQSSGSTSAASSDRASPLAQHLVTDDGRPYLDYIFPSDDSAAATREPAWTWNRSKYRYESRSLQEIVEGLMKEVSSIENAQRNKSGQYGIVKGQVVSAQRKKTGNLSTRSLADVVSAKDFAGTSESEYLETVLVAVPKNLVKEWENSYERLCQMVVPRSSSKLASDDEFVLYGVTIFRRVKDEFSQKCREAKFIVRDFTYDASAIQKAQADLVALEAEEKDLWTDLLRLSRINFSELFQILIHLKVVRAYVESVLRYGLPAAYFGAIIKPEYKSVTKLTTALSEYFGTEGKGKGGSKKHGKGSSLEGTDATVAGEFANVLEGEYLDFVLFEIERVDA
ncbi:BQ5605_C024g09865 [Microbotryum silenes-dioicae]|uniref:V-type proton ATPase subunit C n=1 Tax=Microbotryum silenes-dioicae TaxID=796604 RepID=A0A2X0MLV6_9BASI|nr:BQ5605_C024g09865 [Microbotryum silenes-dioicae]